MLPMRRITYTLVFIKNANQLLLGLKKRGFGQGKWNGFGGKVEKNETILDGAIRETKEECNLDVHPKHIGIIAYENKGNSTVDVVHVFTAKRFSNELKESEEMKPQWFDMEDLPFENMWPCAKFWYPYMLNEKYFLAHAIYEEDTFKNCLIQEFSSLNLVLDAAQKIFGK